MKRKASQLEEGVSEVEEGASESSEGASEGSLMREMTRGWLVLALAIANAVVQVSRPHFGLSGKRADHRQPNREVPPRMCRRRGSGGD